MKSLRRIGRSMSPPHRREMIEVAVEERRLGQHGNRRGAGALVAARDRRRIVVGLQHASRRRAPLALGDHVRARSGSRQRGLKRAAAAARPRPHGARARRAAPAPRARSTMRRVAATMAASRSGACAVDVMTSPAFDAAIMASSVVRGGAGIDRLRRALDAFAHRRRFSADEQRCAGVQQHDVAARALVSPARTSRRIAALAAASPPCRSLALGLRKPEVRRVHVERRHRAVPALRHLRVAGRRHLVDAVGAVHDPRAVRAQQQQRPRNQLGQLRVRHAHELASRAGRVRQRSEQIERRPHARARAGPERHAASTDETSAQRRTRCRPSRATARRPRARPRC